MSNAMITAPLNISVHSVNYDSVDNSSVVVLYLSCALLSTQVILLYCCIFCMNSIFPSPFLNFSNSLTALQRFLDIY